ncbi:MAG: PH domain-containing protein [Candidatus Methanomethylophilaceae archaeon]|nr:PH domain-containing protein [Candidatus Methanomethylophilaceae archaeon]
MPETENPDGFRMLNPVSRKAMYIGNVISLAAYLAIAAAAVFFSRGSAWSLPVTIAMALSSAVLAAYLAISPSVFYRHYRYRIDDDCIEIRRGVIVRSHIIVPVERIHQVSVRKGPVLRRYGLASVTLTTAGGEASLEYLEEETAESVAQRLNEKIISMLKARE